MSLKNKITKKISTELRDKIADFAYKKGKKKLTAEAYDLKGVKFYDDNTASVEFYEIEDMAEYIGYGSFNAKNSHTVDIVITKEELDKLL